MDKMREAHVNKIAIMENAIKRTKSPYLKSDLIKAVKKLKRELREYDSYHKG